jgi:hypothetical protein
MKFTKEYIQITHLFSFLSMSNLQKHAKVGGTMLFRNVAKKHRPETSNNPPIPPSPSPARGNTIRTGGGGSNERRSAISLLPLPPSPTEFVPHARTHTHTPDRQTSTPNAHPPKRPGCSWRKSPATPACGSWASRARGPTPCPNTAGSTRPRPSIPRTGPCSTGTG